MDKLYPSDPSYDGPPVTVPDLTLGERLDQIEEHLGLTPKVDPYPQGAAEANAAAEASLAPEPVDENTEPAATVEPDPEVTP